MKTKLAITALAILMSFSLVSNASAASSADFAFIIDQSGSMRGEFEWLGNSISAMDTKIQDAGVTANYGLAGYVWDAGTDDSRNAWVDLTNDISAITDEVDDVSTYNAPPTAFPVALERGYHALDWAVNNFSWTGGDYAKIAILITDEENDYKSSYSYGGETGEEALAKMVKDNNILLNVITFTQYYQYWDDAAYSKDTYQGLFDLDDLRSDAAAFTEAFVDAKLEEVQNYDPVPEPASVFLLGTGLCALAGFRKKKA